MRGRARRAARWLVRAAGPPVRNGAVALLYHRATRADVDPWRLAVDPEHLGEHLEILARCTRPTTASGLRAAIDRGRVLPRTVVVTFDDGYADLASEVAPRLERAGVPATVFVVSRAVDRDREFWWDGLERALLGPAIPAGPLRLTIGGRVHEWSPSQLGGVPARAGLHRDIWTTLRARPPEERDALVEEVLGWAGLRPEPRATHRTLSSGELGRLAGDGLVEIGAHTANHPWLAGLDPERQRREIERGRSELEERVGGPVDTFAYPHGGPDDVGPTAVDLVRRAGFRSAFLAGPGRLRPRRDVHTLPRLFVEDMDGDAFGRLLWRHTGIRVG